MQNKFVQDLLEAIEIGILQMTKFSNDSLKIEAVKNIISSLNGLIERAYSGKELKEKIENLKLNFIIFQIKSNNQDLRSKGMFEMRRFFDLLKNGNTIISPESMYKLIQDNQILCILFDKDNFDIKNVIT